MALVNTPTHIGTAKHTIDVEIAGFNVDAVERVDINLRENEHDHVRFILSGISPLSVTDYIDVPVKVTVGVGYSNGFTFCGYINSITPSHKVTSGRANGSLFQEAWVDCLGASAKMRGTKSRVWPSSGNNFKVLDMVSEMSIDYGMSYACPSSTPVIPRKVQRGLSDWAILAKSCVDSGLAVNLHGTEIHVWDPYSAIRYGAPSFNLQTVDTIGGPAIASPGRIMEFDGTFGTAHSYGDVNAASMAILDADGQLLTAYSTELLGSTGYGEDLSSGLTDVLAVEALSMADARRKLIASRAYSDAFVAKVSTTGVAGPVPGSVVDVEGFSSEFDGAWLVREMNMKFNDGNFVSEFGLARSTIGKGYIGREPGAYLSPDPDDPVLKVGNLDTNEWRSSTRRAHVYASN